MCNDKTFRIVIKRTDGVPTIPVSTDHRNGDWITTDIYEGEQAMDVNTGIVYTRSATGIEVVGGGAGNIKIWRGLMSQTGTDAPTATVLENTLGGTIVFTYNAVGDYVATLAGAFTLDKTFITVNHVPKFASGFFSAQRASADTLSLKTFGGGFVAADAKLGNTELQIIVYP